MGKGERFSDDMISEMRQCLEKAQYDIEGIKKDLREAISSLGSLVDTFNNTKEGCLKFNRNQENSFSTISERVREIRELMEKRLNEQDDRVAKFDVRFKNMERDYLMEIKAFRDDKDTDDFRKLAAFNAKEIAKLNELVESR